MKRRYYLRLITIRKSFKGNVYGRLLKKQKKHTHIYRTKTLNIKYCTILTNLNFIYYENYKILPEKIQLLKL